MNIGDKVTVLPIEELDVEKCDVCDVSVFGIENRIYENYIGKEYTVKDIDLSGNMNTYSLLEDTIYGFSFPIGCIKKL